MIIMSSYYYLLQTRQWWYKHNVVRTLSQYPFQSTTTPSLLLLQPLNYYSTTSIHHDNSKSQPTKSFTKKKMNKFHDELNKFLSHPTSNNHNSSVSMDTCLKEYEFFASCLPGLESILEMEFKQSNNNNNVCMIQKQKGGISFRVSTMKDLYHCHYYFGCISDILLRCSTFRARGYPELTRKVSSFSFWKNYFQLSTSTTKQKKKNIIYLDIRVSTYKSKLFHTKGIANAICLGIQTSITKHHHSTTNNDDNSIPTFVLMQNDNEEEDEKEVVKLLVRIIRDQVDISIYTLQTPLHRRGYRYETAKAPLREDIAYALVYSTIHHLSSSNNKTIIMMDPFCGSGTIAIEAVTIIKQLPPGRFQSSPFHHLSSKFYSSTLWNQFVLEQQQQQQQPCNNQVVIATDINHGAIQATINNAKRAGVLPYMNIYQSSFPSSLQQLVTKNNDDDDELLVVVTNPPFGKRITSLPKNNIPIKRRHTNGLLPLYQSIYNHSIQKHNIPITILSNDYQLIQSSISGTDTTNKNVTQFTTQHGGIKVCAVTTTPDTTTTTTTTSDVTIQQDS